MVAAEKCPWREHEGVFGVTRLGEEERPRRGETPLSEAARPSLEDRATEP